MPHCDHLTRPRSSPPSPPCGPPPREARERRQVTSPSMGGHQPQEEMEQPHRPSQAVLRVPLHHPTPAASEMTSSMRQVPNPQPQTHLLILYSSLFLVIVITKTKKKRRTERRPQRCWRGRGGAERSARRGTCGCARYARCLPTRDPVLALGVFLFGQSVPKFDRMCEICENGATNTPLGRVEIS